MSESTVRAKIYGLVSSVSGIGKVYDYERWAADWGTFIELFKDPATGTILGWELGRRAAPAEYISNAEELTTHEYTIKGYMAVNDSDESEKTFNGKIEDIRTKFRYNSTLDGLAEMAGPVKVERIDTRWFGRVLCHYGELSISVQ